LLLAFLFDFLPHHLSTVICFLRKLQFSRWMRFKTAFWREFNADNPSVLPPDVAHFLDWHILGDEIRDLQINPRQEFTEFWQVFISVAKRTRTPAEVLRDKELSKLNSPQQTPKSYTSEFESLIQEKIRYFCGRKFVFQAFDNFRNQHTKGYFTVIGDAGMGKSAIAAKYVYDNQAICYFNVLQDGRNRPELFLKSIRQQLINHYNLENAENDDLSALLVKARSKIPDGENLVIVVDALDEVEQEAGGENILYLPKTLPEKVYFLLTRRRYEPSKKRLYTEGVEQVELDLTANQYIEFSRDDIQAYIRFILNHDAEWKDGLRKWMQERNITDETFIEQVAEKSENNFMYLRYVLPAIARGFYNDLSLKELPDGLQQYYQTHWARMEMNEQDKEIKVIILFILVEIGTPIPCEMIADVAEKDEFEVQDILDDWLEYLKKQKVDGDDCYSIYHASFLDFLQAQRVLQAKRQLFTEVNQRIVDYWDRDMQN
ncbi:NACHT domain protein, partial [Tolypothrix sp. FACHB-123]|uniref:NACHT domain protein n=1 Tax=Tolypothrix sp. FACHB-123 TaxID=2692868 RepID=UPI0027D34DE7